MKYFTQLMLVLFTFSACDNNNEKIATEPLNFITIGDKSYGVSSNGTYGNTNCSSIFAHLDYESATDRGFRLAFTLNKYGAVSKVKLMMYQNMVTIYESADFNSSSTFKISNFIYKPEQNFLSFDFEGDLLKVNAAVDEIDNVHLRKYIKGKFNMSNIQDIACGIFMDDLNFSSNDFKFSTNRTFKTATTNPNSSVFETQFYSENGYQISFRNDTDLWTLPLGTYTFTENSSLNKINCSKFIGNPRATSILIKRPVDWKILQTAGSFIISEKVVIRGTRVIKGTFTLKIFENGFVIYDIINGNFAVTGF